VLPRDEGPPGVPITRLRCEMGVDQRVRSHELACEKPYRVMVADPDRDGEELSLAHRLVPTPPQLFSMREEEDGRLEGGRS
jgi:hypothetical protein